MPIYPKCHSNVMQCALALGGITCTMVLYCFMLSVFLLPKLKERTTSFVFMLQPMTTFVTCTVCNNRWKFRYDLCHAAVSLKFSCLCTHGPHIFQCRSVTNVHVCAADILHIGVVCKGLLMRTATAAGSCSSCQSAYCKLGLPSPTWC